MNAECGDSWTAKCPNCGEVATDTYDTGDDQIREFDCRNENCRCQVFRPPQ